MHGASRCYCNNYIIPEQSSYRDSLDCSINFTWIPTTCSAITFPQVEAPITVHRDRMFRPVWRGPFHRYTRKLADAVCWSNCREYHCSRIPVLNSAETTVARNGVCARAAGYANRLRWFVRQLIPLTHDFSSFRWLLGTQERHSPQTRPRAACYTVTGCFPAFCSTCWFATVHRKSNTPAMETYGLIDWNWILYLSF